MAESGEVSKSLDSKPDIFGLEWLWVAYSELGTCRVNGMSLGSIPWTAIVSYVDRYQLNEYEELSINRCIHVLDDVLIKHSEKK